MDITVYSTTGCSRCQMIKAFLQNKNIPFTEKLDETEFMLEHGFRSAPVVEIDGKFYTDPLEVIQLFRKEN